MAATKPTGKATPAVPGAGNIITKIRLFFSGEVIQPAIVLRKTV